MLLLLCKECVKHTFEVTKFVVSQQSLMNKETIDNSLKDYQVRYQDKELHADDMDLWHVMNWFPHNLERSMHKLIMSSKLHF